MTKQEIQNVFKQAKKDNAVIQINSYTTSDGECSDYIVKFGEDYYRELIQQSYNLLTSTDINDLLTVKSWRPDDVSEGDWNEAIKQLTESYTKTLDPNTPSKAFSSSWDYDQETGTLTKKGSDAVAVKNLLRVSKVVVGEPKEATTKNYRNNVTRSKDLLAKQLPIKNHIGQMNFEEGKFKSITIL